MDINMMLLTQKMYVLKKLGIDMDVEYPEIYKDFIKYVGNLLETTDLLISSIEELSNMALNYKINKLIEYNHIDFDKEFDKLKVEFGKFLKDKLNEADNKK